MKTYQIADGSFALANKGRKLEHISGNELRDRKFIVLASGCDLPAYNIPHIDPQRNNIVALDIECGQIVFTQQRFLRKITYCPYCGHSIYMR